MNANETFNPDELHNLAVEVASDQDEDVDARLQAYIVLLLETLAQSTVKDYFFGTAKP